MQQIKMKVLRLHYSWLTWNNMCEDNNCDGFKKIARIGIVMIEQLILFHFFVTSFFNAKEQIKQENFENALYGIFQMTATLFGFCILFILISHNRAVKNLIQRLQNIVDNCKY